MSLFWKQGTRCSTGGCNHHNGATSVFF